MRIARLVAAACFGIALAIHGLGSVAQADEDPFGGSGLGGGFQNGSGFVGTDTSPPTNEAKDLRESLAKFQIKYEFFDSSGADGSGNCFATMGKVTGYLNSTGKYEVDQANTGFKDPSGLMSVTHPSLIVKSKETGHTLLITTALGDGVNNIFVTDLGKEPTQTKVASALMALNNTPIVTFKDSVYANHLALSLWDAAPMGAGAAWCGDYLKLGLGDKDQTELVISHGKLYAVKRLEEKAKLLGMDASLKSVGILPAFNALGTTAAEKVFQQAGGKSFKDFATLAGILSSGQSITRVQLAKEVSPGLTAGVRSYYSVNPQSPLDGFTKPLGFLQYDRGNMSLFGDQRGDLGLDLKRPGGLRNTSLSVAYDGQDKTTSFSVGFDKKFSDSFSAGIRAGYGSTAGNVDLGSNSVRTGSDPSGKMGGFISLNASYRWGKRSGAPKPGEEQKASILGVLDVPGRGIKEVSYERRFVFDKDGKLDDSQTWWTDGKKGPDKKVRRFASEAELREQLAKELSASK